jgi:DNA helicase HerA-like ATPase
LNSSPLGIIVGGARPHRFEFLASRNIRVGEYVTVRAPEGALLGFVEESIVTSGLMNPEVVSSFQSATEAKEVASRNPRDKAYQASVKVIGLLDQLTKGSMLMPSLPPEPGSEVFEASEKELVSVFAKEDAEWARVGSLLRQPTVSASINLNKIAARHLAILAATGSGKSNLLALLAKRTSEAYGTMIIFDYQGEYTSLKLNRLVHVQAKLNPRLLDAERFADLLDIREGAERQRAVLARAFAAVREEKEFWDALIRQLQVIRDEDEDHQTRRVAGRVIEIVERARMRKGVVIDPDIGDPLDQLKANNVNVLNMLELTERQAAVVMSYFMEEILEDRKKARMYSLRGESRGEVRFPSPVMIAIEEAHTFLPAESDTDTKMIASKIAREGRKFGVSLIVVSQRPSRLDQDVLSQMGSLAIMRITQPKDQQYIIDSSELASEKLVEYLPSLNIGEALLLGQWVTLPILAKIEYVPEKLMGMDIDAVNEWLKDKERDSGSLEDTSELIKGRL